MLSYQHAYHAGNPADVHKHAALSVVLSCMARKDKPMAYMETHAGRGLYDLSSPEARKTGEADAGVRALLGRVPEGHPYRTALEEARRVYGEHAYPGSPMIAKTLLRGADALHLMELHPQEHAALARHMKAKNVRIHKRDGFEGALALSPPLPRRGAVLVDPSYEVKTEYGAAAEFVLKLHRKWPEAVLLLWHPLLDEEYHLPLVRRLEEAGLPKFRRQEVRWKDPKRMKGGGLVAVNFPFGAEEGWEALPEWFS
jgi:23S rRNA (adenine2030-N6)-methyltransferase